MLRKKRLHPPPSHPLTHIPSTTACPPPFSETPAIVAFDHMAVDHKSSIGIVDDNGKLIGTLSVSCLG